MQINPSDLSNDSDPVFMNEFYTNLRILSQDLYKRTSSIERRGSRVGGKHDSAASSSASASHAAGSTSNSNSSSTSEYFGAHSMQARMQKYVQEGGGGGIIPAEFLDRYNRDATATAAATASKAAPMGVEEGAGAAAGESKE